VQNNVTPSAFTFDSYVRAIIISRLRRSDFVSQLSVVWGNRSTKLDYRLLAQMTVQDQVVGYNAEIGYVVAKNIRVRAGHNFEGYKKRDLVDYVLRSCGHYVQLDLKFAEGTPGIWNSTS
jgi:hypothetical protein